MKNDLFYKKIGKDILIGVISALIISWLITPVTNFIFPKLINVLDKLSSSLSDSIYIGIAKGFPGNTLTFTFLCVVLCIYLLFMFFIMFIREKINDVDAVFKEEKNYYSNSETTIPTQTDLEAKSKLILHDIELFQKKLCRLRLIFSGISILCLISFSFTTMSQIYISETANNIYANIEIVSPYVSDSEYKHLKSEFHSIRSSKDYLSLINDLSKIAATNDITLQK